MSDEEIDRALGGEHDITPSSRFHASVMEAVRREAATPPPIAFPWKRAWPALAAAALAGAAGPPFFDALIPVAASVGAPWIALAALATAASLFLSRRLSGERYEV